MDQCTHCTMRGDLAGCLATRCQQHESWMVQAVKREAHDGMLRMRAWIDAVPSETALPVMPGFDRDDLDNFMDSIRPRG